MRLHLYSLVWCRHILKLSSLSIIISTSYAAFVYILLFYLNLKAGFPIFFIFILLFDCFILIFFLNFINFLSLIICIIWLGIQWDCNLNKAGVLCIVGFYVGAIVMTARWVLVPDIEHNLRLTVKALFTSFIIFIIFDSIEVLLFYYVALLLLVIFNGFGDMIINTIVI